MRVLLINSVCGYGSTGKIAVDLYQLLEKQGNECCIAYGRGTAPEELNTIKIGNKTDFYSHALMTRIFDCHGFASRAVTERFIEQAKKFDPDVIHLHNIHGYYINVELLFEYLREINKPVIWTLHDCWSFTGHCAHYDAIGCEKWMNQCQHCPLKNDYPQSLLLDSSFRNYEKKKNIFSGVEKMTIVTPSKWLATEVKKSFLKDYPVEVITNGIHIGIFHPMEKSQSIQIKKALSEKYSIDFGKKVLLGVASIWTRDKGFFDFIKMSEILPENAQLVMVGVSKKQKKELPSNVIGIERTENQKELSSLYACADVFLNPTYADTFPTVNLEASACGTPVISYDTGGSTESSDIVVPKGDYERMLQESLRSEKLMSIPKKVCLADLDKDHCLKEYLYLYEEIKRKMFIYEET